VARLACLVLLAGLAGCVTPSIPIPPPDPERMTFAVDTTGGTATFSYGPELNYADAIVYIYNRDRGAGIITTARGDGSVGPTQPFAAAVGENLSITFETDDAVVSSCVMIRDQGPPTPYCLR